jgi:uncharacterized repeat protein (TIGR03803 family)
MKFHSFLASWKSGPSRSRRPQSRLARRSTRLVMEQLETRLTPSLSTLSSFLAPAGAFPSGGLVMDSSGNLYGTTPATGPSNDGTIFEVAHGSGAVTTLASFNGVNGATPTGGLIVDGSGNLYGTTDGGGANGANGNGTIFELAHGSGTITTLAVGYWFPGADTPSGLVMDSTGNLYGTTDDGEVFELAHGSGTINILASFNGANGSAPFSALIVDGSGNLYGTTAYGGANGDGTVFEVAQGSGTISTLATFDGSDGSDSVAPLIMDSSGNLYGTARGGTGYSPNISYGTVFEVAQGSGTITTLATFSGTNGAFPTAGLVRDTSGNLYGTSDDTVFEVAQGSGTITTLMQASVNGANSVYPSGALIMDSSGNLYGTTNGGANGVGAVFELAPGSGAISTLASFLAPNGAVPHGGLIVDSSGNLYGTTSTGGPSGAGTVFEMAPGTGTITTLAAFNGTNGASPLGALTMDGNGNLYGTTNAGGASGDGTVFELAHGSGTITTLATFNGANGLDPLGGLIRDNSGNLYGATIDGGASGQGTVFEVVHGNSTITTLASFNVANGENPSGALIVDGNGNLYGTAGEGGARGYGTVFELAHGSGTITTLASFGTLGQYPYFADGAYPSGGLILDGSGNLYGTAAEGGASDEGTVFELVHGSRTITTLASFNGANGAYPSGGLFRDSSGNLYGTTRDGGANDLGVVFELSSGTIGTLASFNGANGSDPVGPLMMDSNGNLFGTTSAGGASGVGTVFELANVAKGAAICFQVTGFPSPTTAGVAQSFTVTTQNADGSLATGFTGTIHFTSSDPHAVLPADYTFTPYDRGVHTFSVTLETAGSRSITATDGSITGSEAGIVVNPAAAAQLILSEPATVKSGAAFSMTLTVEDAYGNVVTGYVGTVHFSSSDSTSTLPANYTFTAADAGVHTFTYLTTLRKKSKQTTITVTDLLNSALTTTDDITVN